MKTEPLVSIVIPTWNSEKTLALCLKSIKNQTYKNIEVIIVDKFSKDRTIKIAKRFNAKICLLEAERSKAKNFGVKRAVGNFVCFIDSDMELASDVIEECMNLAIKNRKIGGIIIPERSVGNSYVAKIRDFERSFYLNSDVESARFFRKDLVKTVGGFDKDITFFEESTLPQKIDNRGYNVKARIESEILHQEDVSVSGILRKKYQYGKTSWKYQEGYKEYWAKQMSLSYRLGLFLKNRRFYSKPLLALGVLILKCLEYISVGLGYLVGKMS